LARSGIHEMTFGNEYLAAYRRRLATNDREYAGHAIRRDQTASMNELAHGERCKVLLKAKG